MKKTEKVYRDDVYAVTADAEILAVCPPATRPKGEKVPSGVSRACREDRLARMAFDRSIFAPCAGGQDSDQGRLMLEGTQREIFVSDVYEADGVLWHCVRASDAEGFEPGGRVRMELDWPRRLDHMQRHLGEHILSGAFHRLFRGVNRGFHMGEDGMTIDIAFEAPEAIEPDEIEGRMRPTRVTWEMAEAAEAEANRVIRCDAPVTVTAFDTPEQAAAMPLRKDPSVEEGETTVVTVGDPQAPFDCVTCCGTHPSSTGQVGLVKIYKIESNKGMSRIYFEAGARAFARTQRQCNLLYETCVALSAGEEDLIGKMEAREAREEALRQELSQLRSRTAGIEAERILRTEGQNVFRYDDLSTEVLLSVAKALEGVRSGAAILVSVPEKLAFIAADGKTARADETAKDLMKTAGGRGGGSATLARVKLADRTELKAFLDAAGH